MGYRIDGKNGELKWVFEEEELCRSRKETRYILMVQFLIFLETANELDLQIRNIV